MTGGLTVNLRKVRQNLTLAVSSLILAQDYLRGELDDFTLDDKVALDDQLSIIRELVDQLERGLERAADGTYRRDLGLTGR